MNICESCPIRKICRIKDPVDIKGRIPAIATDCLVFTCIDGERAAGRAIRNDDRKKSFHIDGRIRDLFRFGTRHKPTHKSFFWYRWVDTNGNIYFNKRGSFPQKTGQNIYT